RGHARPGDPAVAGAAGIDPDPQVGDPPASTGEPRPLRLRADRGRDGRDHRTRADRRPALRWRPRHPRGDVSEPATPYLRVDIARLRANITRTAARAATAGISLRPH